MTITASGMLVLVAAALVAVGGGALVVAYNRLVRRRNLERPVQHCAQLAVAADCFAERWVCLE